VASAATRLLVRLLVRLQSRWPLRAWLHKKVASCVGTRVRVLFLPWLPPGCEASAFDGGDAIRGLGECVPSEIGPALEELAQVVELNLCVASLLQWLMVIT